MPSTKRPPEASASAAACWASSAGPRVKTPTTPVPSRIVSVQLGGERERREAVGPVGLAAPEVGVAGGLGAADELALVAQRHLRQRQRQSPAARRRSSARDPMSARSAHARGRIGSRRDGFLTPRPQPGADRRRSPRSLLIVSCSSCPGTRSTDTPERAGARTPASAATATTAAPAGRPSRSCAGCCSLAAFAPLILAWILVRGHKLSWAPGRADDGRRLRRRSS